MIIYELTYDDPNSDYSNMWIGTDDYFATLGLAEKWRDRRNAEAVDQQYEKWKKAMLDNGKSDHEYLTLMHLGLRPARTEPFKRKAFKPDNDVYRIQEVEVMTE